MNKLQSPRDSPAPPHSWSACRFAQAFAYAFGNRTVRSLDGQWEIAEGSMSAAPALFDHRVPVPGLVDGARPPFAEVGQKSPRREAFWYRRTFKVKGEVPAVALLKVHKAAYGSRVFLNGVLLGEHLPSFTPGYFDARPALHGNGAVNEVVVRVGASREALPPTVASGWDFEKVRYIPGLFDSVELILSGTPDIVRVQVAPEIASQTIRVQAVRPECRPEDHRAIALQGARGALGKDGWRGQFGTDHTRQPRRTDCGGADSIPPLPAVVTGGPLPLRAGDEHRRGHAAHALRHAGVSPRPRDRPRDAEWPPVFPARQQRDALPLLRGPGVRRPSLAGSLGAAPASGVQGDALERVALLHRLPAGVVVSHRRRGRHPDPGRVPHLARAANGRRS